MLDAIRHILTVLKMSSLYSVIQSCHQIPMGLKAAVKICLNLSDHFLQLIGTLLFIRELRINNTPNTRETTRIIANTTGKRYLVVCFLSLICVFS